MPLPLISYTAQITPLLSLMENSLHRIKTKKITFKDFMQVPLSWDPPLSSYYFLQISKTWKTESELLLHILLKLCKFV